MTRRHMFKNLGIVAGATALSLVPRIKVEEEKPGWKELQRVRAGQVMRPNQLNQYAEAIEELRAEIERLKKG